MPLSLIVFDIACASGAQGTIVYDDAIKTWTGAGKKAWYPINASKEANAPKVIAGPLVAAKAALPSPTYSAPLTPEQILIATTPCCDPIYSAPLTPPPPLPSSPLPSSPPPVPSLPSVSLSSADPERDRRSLPRRWLGRHRRPRLREAVCPRDHGAAAAAPRHLPRRAAASKGLASLWPARHGQDVDREGEHCGRSRKRQLLHVCCYY